MALTVGTKLGPHEITSLLGKGGMGEVYRARDLKLKREVAIKILPEEFSRDADRVSRFQREAEVLASLNHPHIAAIYDIEEANGSRYLVLGLLGLYLTRIEPREIRVQINTPSTQDPTSFAISPDGQRMVFVANNDGKPQLWIRPLDSLAAQPLPGTDSATYPFWSPDSPTVGFFANGKLKGIDVAGGGPQTLANATSGFGGSWNQNGVILFSGTVGGSLLKVAATGGEAEPVTADTNTVIYRFPQFLPDGNHFIFTSLSTKPGIYLSSLDGLQPRLLVNGDTAASITPSGFLFFLRQGTLFAQSFDFKKLEVIREPVPIAEQVVTDQLDASGFSVAPGIIAYRPGGSVASRQLTWFDRTGKTLGVVGEIDSNGLNTVDLSPDGRHVAVMRSPNSNTDIWLLDTGRGIPTRFTFDAAIDAQPVWSPDGSRVVFSSNRKGIFNLYSKLASNVAEEDLLLATDQVITANDLSSDGRFLLFRSADPKNGYDLWVLPMFGEKKPVPFLATPFDERDGQFSRMGDAWLISPMSLDVSKSTFSPFQDLVKNCKSRPAAALRCVGDPMAKRFSSYRLTAN